MSDKVDVNGQYAHDVFKYLRGNTKELIDKRKKNMIERIPWNFCRWVVDKEGQVQMYLNPTMQIHNCYPLVEKLCKLDNKASKNKNEKLAEEKSK